MVQGPGQFRHSLKQLLQTQGECAESLLSALEDEHGALMKADAEKLDAVTAGKTALLQRLDDLGRQQIALLESLSFDPHGDGMGQALAWCDPAGDLAREQAQVLAQLEQCRAINDRNGLAVQQRLGYVRRALDVLHGAPAGSSGNVYGPDGRADGMASSRLLASG